MNRHSRNFALLAAGWLLIVAEMFLTGGSSLGSRYALLLFPLLLLAGYLEGHLGALVMVQAGGLTLIAAALLARFPWETALALGSGLGFWFCLVAIEIHDAEIGRNLRNEARIPLEQEWRELERKARLIHAEIEEGERELKELIQLYDASKRLTGMLHLGELLDEARSVVGKILPRHFSRPGAQDSRLAFYLSESGRKDFHRTTAVGHEISDAGFAESAVWEDLPVETGDGFRAVQVPDLNADDRWRVLAVDPELRSLAFFPLLIHETVIGMMVLASRQRDGFSGTDFSRLEVFAKQIAFSVRKSLLYREVQTLSITDSQTGVYVHRYFQERLREELHRAGRYHQFVSLIMLDLDHFKRVNDTYGHPVGDAVLSETARRIWTAAGPRALVARYGGEEFAILLPNTPKAKAFQIAKAVNLFVKSSAVEVGGERLAVTLSAGVGTYPEDAVEQDALIAAADSALYESKRNGRDLVMLYTENV